MKSYISLFKIRLKNSLQYRTAAYAGVITQMAWGFMYIMLYNSFYKSNPSAVPMEFSKLSSYIWLQQAFLSLFMVWALDQDIFDIISNGNVAYEMERPLDIYNMWFAKNIATRVSKALLRFAPILIIASFLPGIYKFKAPYSLGSFILFIFSMAAGLFVVIAYCMIIYVLTFFTISPMGIRMVMVMICDFFSGALIPLPLLPGYLTKYIYYLPFASMQNTPFMIYTGALGIKEGIFSLMIQLIWIVLLVFIGRIIIKNALKKVIIQGG